MKKVIVTGGAGFIGSHTCVELATAGFTPVIVDDLRNSEERALDGIARIIGLRPSVHRIDCCDALALERVFAEEGKVYGAIHFAADKAVGESVTDPLKYYRNNIGSLVTLLGAMKRYTVPRVVFSSSCTVYGQPTELPVKETAPDRNSMSPYGFTKIACEQLLRDTTAEGAGLRAVLLRYFNPVGAHPSAHIGELPLGVPNNLVPFVTQTVAGVRQQLTVFGGDYDTPDGSCIRDYIHVVDLAQAHVRALQWMDERPDATCEVFNIGTGTGNSVLEVIRVFEEATGMRPPHVIGPRRSGDTTAVYADTSKSHDVLGWRPKLTLKQALADAWRWQQTLT
jgi:UDP-glucose 4-epimerase